MIRFYCNITVQYFEKKTKTMLVSEAELSVAICPMREFGASPSRGGGGKGILNRAIF